MNNKYEVIELDLSPNKLKTLIKTLINTSTYFLQNGKDVFSSQKTCVLIYPKKKVDDYYIRQKIKLKGIVLNFTFSNNYFIIKSVHNNKKESNILIKYYDKFVYCEKLKPFNGYTLKILFKLVNDFTLLFENYYPVKKCIIDEKILFKNYNFKHQLNKNKIQIPSSILNSKNDYIIQNTLMTVKNILLYRNYVTYHFEIELKCPYKNIKEELNYLYKIRQKIILNKCYNDYYFDKCYNRCDVEYFTKYNYIYNSFKQYNVYKHKLKKDMAIIFDVIDKINFRDLYKFIKSNFDTVINEKEEIIYKLFGMCINDHTKGSIERKINKWKNDLIIKMNIINNLDINEIKFIWNINRLISIFTLYFTINQYFTLTNKESFYQKNYINEFNLNLYNSIYFLKKYY